MHLPSTDLKQQHGLHITLHFIGPIAEKKQYSLIEILTQIRASAFTVKIQGAGAFSSGSIPACLWAGVEKGSLHKAIGDSLAKFKVTKFVLYCSEILNNKPHYTRLGMFELY